MLNQAIADVSSSSTITLSCLASAVSYLSCTELSHHVEDHYSINENYVPSDFLALVSDALVEAYPQTDTLEAIPREDAVSPAVYALLSTLCDKFDTLPTEFAHQAYEIVRPGLSTWLSDNNKVVMRTDADLVSTPQSPLGIAADVLGGQALRQHPSTPRSRAR